MSYIVGHPIKRPQDFYGRQEQVTRFYEIVGGAQAQSLSILGLRRAGKTSFLQYVAQPQVMARYLAQPQAYTFVYLDMSACKSPADFYQRLLGRLKAGLGQAGAVGEPPLLWRQSAPGAASLYDVEGLLCQFPERRVVLLLDEFDHLRTDTFDQDFLIELRAMTGVLEYDLACVTASYWDLYYLGNQVGLPPTSPFYNIFYPSPLYLSGLETAAIEALVRTPAERQGVAFDKQAMAEIGRLAGSLPFFLQATSARWLQQQGNGQRPDAEAIGRQLTADLAPYFQQWWRHFDTGHREVLRCVAYEIATEVLPYSTFEIEEALRRLRSYGLLCQEGGRLAINGALFATWIREFSQVAESRPRDGAAMDDSADPSSLRQALVDYFSLDELRTLCFDLGLDFEDLPGSSKGAKARHLVQYCRNRRDLDRLVKAIRQERGAIV